MALDAVASACWVHRQEGQFFPEGNMPLKVREMIKKIEADGWTLVRTKGSHRQFAHPTKPGVVTIAGRLGADLPAGTERSILKQAGL